MRHKMFVIMGIAVLLCLIQLMLYKWILYEDTPEKIIVWWTPFKLGYEERKLCEQHRCIFSDDRKYYNHLNLGAFLFYGSYIQLPDLPFPKRNIPYAIYHEESPKNLPFLLYKPGQDLFDIISTFDRRSDFPLTLQYLPDMNLLSDVKYFVPLSIKNKQDIAPLLYIQSGCETPVQRDLYVKELMKYIAVDSYGTCLNNKKIPDEYKINGTYDVYEENFLKFVAQYKFTIAIENSICNDYITEKLWRPLIVGSIPIYLGSPSVEEWLPNTRSAILINNFQSIEGLAKYLHLLNDDDTLYSEYLAHKLAINRDQRITNKMLIHAAATSKTSISDYECFVCEVINKKEKIKKSNFILYDCPHPRDLFGIENTWKQHWDMGKCQNDVLSNLLKNNTTHIYSPQSFDSLVTQKLMQNDC